MKVLLSAAAAAIIAAGTGAALAQDKPQQPAPNGQHARHHHGMHWKGHHMRRPVGTMIDVEKKGDGYKVRVVCSPKTSATDCMDLTNKLLDRFPAAK